MRRRTRIALACPTPLAGVLRDLGADDVMSRKVNGALEGGPCVDVRGKLGKLGNSAYRGIRHWVR